MNYLGKLKTQLYWWLVKSRPFILNDQYQIELLHIDKDNNSVKILITNLQTGQQISTEQGASNLE